MFVVATILLKPGSLKWPILYRQMRIRDKITVPGNIFPETTVPRNSHEPVQTLAQIQQ